MSNIINRAYDKVYVINMEKSKTRMEKIDKLLRHENIVYSRFNAIDGSKLTYDEISKISTPLCSKLCSKSIIGCALSHISIWKETNKYKYNSVLILEDDISFSPNYKENLRKSIEQLPNDWDILFLGCGGLCSKTETNDLSTIIYRMIQHNINNKKISNDLPNIFIPKSPTGLYGYAVSKSGCEKLLKLITNINYHIDYQLASQHNNLNIYAVYPKCIYPNTDDSTISLNRFPNSLNKLLDKFKDTNNIQYSWYTNLIILEIGGVPVNLWSIIFLLLGFFSIRLKTIRYLLLALLIIELPYLNRSYIYNLIYMIIGLSLGLITTK